MSRFAILVMGGLLAASLGGCAIPQGAAPVHQYQCAPPDLLPGTGPQSDASGHLIYAGFDSCPRAPGRPKGNCPVDPGKPGGAQEKSCSNRESS